MTEQQTNRLYPRHESGLTCIHAEQGLCENCQEEYEQDNQGWIEFGDHTAGLRRWEELRAEMELVGRPQQEVDWDMVDVPF